MKKIATALFFISVISHGNESPPVTMNAQTNPAAFVSLELVDQDGKPFQLKNLKGKYIFLSFIYTSCPIHDMCPKTMKLNARLLKKWGETKQRFPLHLLIVTLDPKKDNPSELKRYAQSYSLDPNHVTLVTGEAPKLSDFAAEFNVVGIPDKGMISHNIRNILLDPGFKEIKKFDENAWTPEDVLSEIEKSKQKLG